jgi:hypothetical protein
MNDGISTCHKPYTVMTITDTTIKNAKPIGKPYKISVSGGMYVLVHSNGGKYFRLDYRFEGKRKTLALGTYPDVLLKLAQERQGLAKQQIADGIDPNTHKQATKAAKAESAANSFEVIANEWLVKKTQNKSDRPQRLLSHLTP